MKLHDQLSILTARSLVEAIKGYTKGLLLPKKQIEYGVTYAQKIKKNESHLDWTLSSKINCNKIRALYPFPGTYTSGPVGLLKIIKAQVINKDHNLEPGTIIDNKNKLIVACGENSSLEITEVQKPGKSIVSVSAYLNGTQLDIGEQFGK